MTSARLLVGDSRTRTADIDDDRRPAGTLASDRLCPSPGGTLLPEGEVVA